MARRGDDASMFVEWLFDDSLADQLVGEARQKFWPLLTRLFVAASRNGLNGTAIAGDRLIEGLDMNDEFAGTDTSRWTLALNLDSAQTEAIRDELIKRGGVSAETVEAGKF